MGIGELPGTSMRTIRDGGEATAVAVAAARSSCPARVPAVSMDRPLGSDLRRDGSRNGGGGHHQIGLGGVGIGKGRRGISSVGPSCQRAPREKTQSPRRGRGAWSRTWPVGFSLSPL